MKFAIYVGAALAAAVFCTPSSAQAGGPCWGGGATVVAGYPGYAVGSAYYAPAYAPRAYYPYYVSYPAFGYYPYGYYPYYYYFPYSHYYYYPYLNAYPAYPYYGYPAAATTTTNVVEGAVVDGPGGISRADDATIRLQRLEAKRAEIEKAIIDVENAAVKKTTGLKAESEELTREIEALQAPQP